MNESKTMAGGMTPVNRAILIAAFLLLLGAVGYAIWRDSANNAAAPAPMAAAIGSDSSPARRAPACRKAT